MAGVQLITFTVVRKPENAGVVVVIVFMLQQLSGAEMKHMVTAINSTMASDAADRQAMLCRDDVTSVTSCHAMT